MILLDQIETVAEDAGFCTQRISGVNNRYFVKLRKDLTDLRNRPAIECFLCFLRLNQKVQKQNVFTQEIVELADALELLCIKGQKEDYGSDTAAVFTDIRQVAQTSRSLAFRFHRTQDPQLPHLVQELRREMRGILQGIAPWVGLLCLLYESVHEEHEPLGKGISEIALKLVDACQLAKKGTP